MCPLSFSRDRAVLYSNRAAARAKLVGTCFPLPFTLSATLFLSPSPSCFSPSQLYISPSVSSLLLPSLSLIPQNISLSLYLLPSLPVPLTTKEHFSLSLFFLSCHSTQTYQVPFLTPCRSHHLFLLQDQKKHAIRDCTHAIELDEGYTKALLRRATLNQETDQLDDALRDFQRVLELEPSNRQAQEAVRVREQGDRSVREGAEGG